jgi:gamma-glutamyl phosphate reductase
VYNFNCQLDKAVAKTQGAYIMSTKIIINAVTHRDSCLHGSGAEDAAVYDEKIDSFFERLATAAREAGFELEIDQRGQGRYSYIVDEIEHDDYVAANIFMQSPEADFWAQI